MLITNVIRSRSYNLSCLQYIIKDFSFKVCTEQGEDLYENSDWIECETYNYSHKIIADNSSHLTLMMNQRKG